MSGIIVWIVIVRAVIAWFVVQDDFVGVIIVGGDVVWSVVIRVVVI